MASAQDWNTSYESTPNLNTDAFLLAGEITSTRYNTRRILGKEHHFSVPEEGGTYVLQGVHKQGSAKAYVGVSEPLTRPDGTAFESHDEGTLWIDETGGGAVLKYYKATQGRMVPVRSDLTGMIAFFPKRSRPPQYARYEEWGWLPCDGSLISTNPTDPYATYKGPELISLVRYLAGSQNATSARLPRMCEPGQAKGRFVRCAGTESGTLETPTGWEHQTPKLIDETVKSHTHTMVDTGITWSGNDPVYITLSETQLASKPDYNRYLYAGQHSHTISSGSANSGGLFRMKPTTDFNDPKHLYSDTTPYSPGSSTWNDTKAQHQHVVEITRGPDFKHVHTVESSGEEENLPKGIYLFPFIHV